jgi:hypothetical protein
MILVAHSPWIQAQNCEMRKPIQLLLLLHKILQERWGMPHIAFWEISNNLHLVLEVMNDGLCFLFVMCVNSGPLEGHVGERFLCYLDAVTATGFSSLSLLSCIKIE